MYSVVLMAALTTAVDMPERGGRRGGGGCCGCYGGGGYGGGGCYGGGGWGGGYGGCYGGMGMGMGWGGCYGGMGMGWGGGCGGWGGGYGGGMRTSWGGWGYGNSGYALGNNPYGFNNYAYSPMMSTWGTPITSTWGTPNVSTGGTMFNPATQSFYLNPARANEATIIVHLPNDALLKIEDQQMQSQSNTRVFTSPPLEPGKTYTYTLRAEVNRDGKTVTDQRSVDVRAGQTSEVSINFEGSRNRGNEDNEPIRQNRTPRTAPPPPSDQ